MVSRQGRAQDDEFERTVLDEWPTLVKVAARYRGSDADANDVLQDAVTRAYRAWRTGQVREDLARYLTVTVRNVAIGLHRRQRSEARALDRLATQQTLTAPSADDAVLRNSDHGAVAAAFNRLSDRCREILQLRVLEGVPEAEIAERLFIARGTVKSRCHRCLAELAQSLESSR
jgi:RNA polymerase sigma factor (sigma-70 family)